MRSALTGSLVALAVFPLLVSSGVRKSDRTRQIIPHPPHPPAAACAPTLAARATCAVRRAAVQSLIEFYKQLGGPYWTNNDGWDPDGGADPATPRPAGMASAASIRATSTATVRHARSVGSPR